MAATMATAGASLVNSTLFFYSTVYRSLPATAAARLRLDPRIMAWPQQQIRALLLLLLSRRVQSHSFPIERGADVVVQKRTSIRFAYIYISRQQNTRTWGSWGKSVTPSSCPSFHCNQLPIRSFYIYFRRICWRSVLFLRFNVQRRRKAQLICICALYCTNPSSWLLLFDIGTRTVVEIQ